MRAHAFTFLTFSLTLSSTHSLSALSRSLTFPQEVDGRHATDGGNLEQLQIEDLEVFHQLAELNRPLHVEVVPEGVRVSG